MITRKQATLARVTTAPVFAPDGMERTVTGVSQKFDTVIVRDNEGAQDVFRFDELEPSRDLLALDR